METLTVTPKEEALPEDLALILARAKARSKKRNRNFAIFLSVFSFLALPCLIGATLSHIPALLALMTIITYASALIFLIYALSRTWKGMYGLNECDFAQLSSINDRRVLRVLLDIPLFPSNKTISLQREELLKHWLPLLTSEEAHLLSKRQKQRLAEGIHMFEEDVTREIFSTLEQIGDTDHLFSLKLWNRKQAGKRVKPETLAAYKSCFAAIEARAASTRSDAQLLRPSSPTDGADTYLRPVTQEIDENAETLLRSDLTPRSPLPVPSCLGEEGEIYEETVGEDVRESKP